MIYLFNSGYRPLYLRNVLNTLFIPDGGMNEYRYRVRGERTNVAPSSIEELKGAAQGEQVALTFVDRFGHGGYIYHPIRVGKLIECREQDDYLYFRVQLSKFIYPRELPGFQQHVQTDLLPKGIPKLTDADSENPNDGYYAVTAGSLFSHESDFWWGDEAWFNAVDNLQGTHAFGGRESEQRDRLSETQSSEEYLFVKCDIVVKSRSSKVVTPTLMGKDAVFDLVRGRRYDFVLTYKYPAQLRDASHLALIEVKLGENLKALGEPVLNIDSYSNSMRLPFTTKRHLEDYDDGASFEFRAKKAGHELIGPDSRLVFRISESRAFWVQVTIGLIAYAGLSVLIGTDMTTIMRVGPVQAFALKAFAGLCQAFALLWLVRLVGKTFL